MAEERQGTMGVKPGWRGRFFEDFQVGDGACGPSLRGTDRVRAPLASSAFTIALVTGQSVSDISQNVMANLGWDEVRLPHPLFEGDTVYSVSEVIATRESKSRPNVGIVSLRTTGFNQDGVPVITFKRTVMVYRRGRGPSIARVAS